MLGRFLGEVFEERLVDWGRNVRVYDLLHLLEQLCEARFD